MNINWKHVFNWKIETVSKPYLVRAQDLDSPVYAVDVKYVYHGVRTKKFALDGIFAGLSYFAACRYAANKLHRMKTNHTK